MAKTKPHATYTETVTEHDPWVNGGTTIHILCNCGAGWFASNAEYAAFIKNAHHH